MISHFLKGVVVVVCVLYVSLVVSLLLQTDSLCEGAREEEVATIDLPTHPIVGVSCHRSLTLCDVGNTSTRRVSTVRCWSLPCPPQSGPRRRGRLVARHARAAMGLFLSLLTSLVLRFRFFSVTCVNFFFFFFFCKYHFLDAPC